jgi:hypothetical protein
VSRAVALLTAARRLAFAVAVAAVWLGHRATADACSCIQPPAPRAAAAESTVVFEGRTFGMHHEAGIDGGQSFSKLRFSFEVTRVWKGDVGAKIDITTPSSPAMCGRAFELGVQYVVYARTGEGGVLVDSLCSRTRSAKNATEDLAELGPGVPPTSGAIASPPAGAAVEPPRIEPGPPPSAPSKRGCGVDPHGDAPLVLVLVPFVFVRRFLHRSRT